MLLWLGKLPGKEVTVVEITLSVVVICWCSDTKGGIQVESIDHVYSFFVGMFCTRLVKDFSKVHFHSECSGAQVEGPHPHLPNLMASNWSAIKRRKSLSTPFVTIALAIRVRILHKVDI